MQGAEQLVVDFTQAIAVLQILPQMPLLSSASANWQGIQLNYHRQPMCETPEHSSANHIISICVGSPVVKERVLDGRVQRDYFTYVDISITPAHFTRKVRLEQAAELIHLYPDPVFVTQIAQEFMDTDCVEIIPQFKIRDPLIEGIGLALKAELQSGSVKGQIYVESAATMLVMHMMRDYAVQKQRSQNIKKLSSSKLRQAINYICDHCHQNISLNAIANEVGISRSHFARMFKESTGVTPHQYLIQCRLKAAKRLLADPKLSIAQISKQLGFSSISQFTTFFTRYTKVNPKGFRQGL